jgi:aryl-alcohol dehydrogenase-like predicted oxidoreductase/predicted kinase
MWLHTGDARIALGCMRAFTNDGDPARGADAIVTALDAGITIFDTARAYGDSEQVLGNVLRERGVDQRARVVTKGGMLREGRAWQPDGRARTLRSDCETSLRMLGVPIDTYLVHAPDPRVPWETTVRALGKIAEEKLATHVGVCNVTRNQLDEALVHAPISVVQVDPNAAIRGGVAARCFERGIVVMIHSPFGGPKRARAVARDPRAMEVATRHHVSAHAASLAVLLETHPWIVPVAGATRPETVRDCMTAIGVKLEPRTVSTPVRTGAEIVLLMGIQGSGKTTLAAEYVARGYERLNRDERGGTLRGLHMRLDDLLARGASKVVLDNTYTTRAARYDAITVAHARDAAVHGVWIETPIEQAQVNVIERMLAAHGRLLEPREMERARDPSALSPTALLRIAREVERPEADEGFESLELRPFARQRVSRGGRARFVAREAEPGADDVTFAWQADAMLTCLHEGGPPRCWCRPPYPGLLLSYARAHDVDLARSEVIGTSPAHEKMAAAVGASYRTHRQDPR